jgi:hypothetical protein
LKKQIITVFEPMYLKILNNDMVGFANTTTRDMLEHLFLSYGSITAVDLEHNWKNMRRAWDPQQPVETLFKHIQDSVDYAEEGGSLSVKRRSSAYAKIFSTGNFNSDCRHWNERNPPEQTWNNFKIHFATAYPHANTSGKASAQILHLPLGDDSSPSGDNAVGR